MSHCNIFDQFSILGQKTFTLCQSQLLCSGFMSDITYCDIIKILGLVLRKTSEIWFSNIGSHYSNKCHSRDLNALYESPKVGNPQGNAILSFCTINGAKKAGKHFFFTISLDEFYSLFILHRAKTVMCDMPFFSGSSTFGQESLGGGPAYLWLLFGH